MAETIKLTLPSEIKEIVQLAGQIVEGVRAETRNNKKKIEQLRIKTGLALPQSQQSTPIPRPDSYQGREQQAQYTRIPDEMMSPGNSQGVIHPSGGEHGEGRRQQ